MFEMNDTFVEESVKTKDKVQNKILMGLCIALAIICLGASLFKIASIVTGILFIVFIVLAYMLMGNKNIEYEYDYTNGSLEIAKIINNEKRKHLLTVESDAVKLIAAEGVNEYLKYDNVNMKIYDCSGDQEEAKKYVLVAHDEKKNVDFKVYFNPSEKLIAAMKKYNKQAIYE